MSSRRDSKQTLQSRNLAVEVRTVNRKLKLRLRAQQRTAPSQTSVILRLEENGPATVSSLARAEGMRPQSMSAIVLPLQERHLVSGAPDLGDGQQTLISLTPKCLKWIQEGRAVRQDWLTITIAQKLSVNEQQRPQEALALLTRLAED